MTKNYDEGKVAWLDFEPEPDTTGDGEGDPNKHILTIADGLGTNDWPEEIAVIVHRTCPDENGVHKFPIDGELANQKRRNAQVIVDALNANHGGETFAEKLWKDALEPDDRVFGDVGVFYADKHAHGTVLNLVAPDCVHVLLDDQTKAVVPISSVRRT